MSSHPKQAVLLVVAKVNWKDLPEDFRKNPYPIWNPHRPMIDFLTTKMTYPSLFLVGDQGFQITRSMEVKLTPPEKRTESK